MFADGFGGSKSTKTKFRLVGGAQPLILLPVTVNGRGPFEFILDTGAGISLLTTELAQQLEVKPIGAKDGHSAGGKVAVSLARVDSVAIGDTKIEHVDVAIIDLSQVGQTIGTKIEGDLGYNFFKDFRLLIDYEKLELRLDDPKRVEHVGGSALTEVPIRLAAPTKPLILVETFINGEGPFQFAVDTGTSTTAISAELAEKFKLETIPIGPATTGGAHVEVTAGKVSSMQVGGARLDDVPVVIGPFLAMLSQVAGAKLDGIVGYNFFRNYKVMIDYPNLRLSLFAK